MATQSKRAHCPICDTTGPHTREVGRVNHILHLILSILTGGIWLFVWLLLAILPNKKGKWSCGNCGASESQMAMHNIKQTFSRSEA